MLTKGKIWGIRLGEENTLLNVSLCVPWWEDLRALVQADKAGVLRGLRQLTECRLCD